MMMQNRIAESTAPCLTPFRMSTQRDVPISVLIYAFEFSYDCFRRLMYFLLIDVLSSSIHKQESLTLSKAFVKSMNVIWTGLLNSMDFSMICSGANICLIVPLPRWYAACVLRKDAYRSVLVRVAIILTKSL